MLRLDRNSLNTKEGTLREDVGELRCRRNMEDMNLTDGNLLSDEMKINLHMLRALMLNGVGGEVHCDDVVVVGESAARWQSLELMQELAQPGASATPLAMARYSASALEREMTVCRLADQETRLSPRSTA
jgi:hypothetical protein